MNKLQAKQLSDQLQSIAKDIRETAIGSSRVAMYEVLATEVIRIAKQVLTLAK